MNFVTPCVGVWIETNNWEPSPQMGEVTPCVGVWIETFLITNLIYYQKSHPAWVCGLKHEYICPSYKYLLSHPAWVCGLKPQIDASNCSVAVTPCVGVWIETAIPNGRSI